MDSIYLNIDRLLRDLKFIALQNGDPSKELNELKRLAPKIDLCQFNNELHCTYSLTESGEDPPYSRSFREVCSKVTILLSDGKRKVIKDRRLPTPYYENNEK